MRYLNLSKDGKRFTLTLKATLPLRAAACSIRGNKHEGEVDGLTVYSFPADPDTCDAIMDTFAPDVHADAARKVSEMRTAQASLVNAVALKDAPAVLAFDPLLQTTPMGHQVQGLNFCAARADAGATGSALLMEQGTGKSLIAVGLANHWHSTGRIRWGMVMCPNSLKGTWGAEDGEITLHTDSTAAPYTITTLRGTRTRRLEQFATALLRIETEHDRFHWVITNYDQLSVDLRSRRKAGAEEGRAFIAMAETAPPALLVFDESAQVKNHRSLRGKACLQLAEHFALRLILTGTPLTRAPLDLWAQFQLLQEGALGFNSYLAFERAYAIKERVRTGPRRSDIREVVGYRNLDDLEHRVAQTSYRVLAADCLDLPPVVRKRIPVELGPSQSKAIRQLKTDMVAELGEGDALEFVDGRNMLPRMGKLAEIAGGWVKALDGAGRKKEKATAFSPNGKLDALRSYLDVEMENDPQRKVVVFANYSAEVAGIVNAAAKWGAVPFDGSVSETEREENRARFNRDDSCRVFVAQYKCGSMGLNLTVADTLVFYSLTFSYGDFAQAQKRVHRKGQTAGEVREVYLMGRVRGARGTTTSKSLDYIIMDALESKKDLADIVTGDKARSILEKL